MRQYRPSGLMVRSEYSGGCRPRLHMSPRRGWLATPAMKIYTKTGDDGTPGLYGGGRVRKEIRGLRRAARSMS